MRPKAKSKQPTPEEISIHTSIKDATQEITDIQNHLKHFNSHIHKGCDAAALFLYCVANISIHTSIKDATYADGVGSHVEIISIHTSIKDATVSRKTQTNNFRDFNSHIHKGCDVLNSISDRVDWLFQFTHP